MISEKIHPHHLQRKALLVLVLVDEERSRILVAGHQPAADEREAKRIEIGRAHLEAEAAQ